MTAAGWRWWQTWTAWTLWMLLMVSVWVVIHWYNLVSTMATAEEALVSMCDERARMLQDQFAISVNHVYALAILISTFHYQKNPSALDQKSFRIGGSIEGEVERLCLSLGLSGPENFAIPTAAWDASFKVRSSRDLTSRSQLLTTDGGGGICSSTNKSVPDILRSFESDGENEGAEERIGCGEDDEDSATTDSMFVISPNEGLKRIVGSWMRGQLLGSGSFETVYEGINE